MSDELERQMSQRQFRRAPTQWRAEILAAARQLQAQDQPRSQPSWVALPGTILDRVRSVLWPSPRAWAGLAAVWVVIGALNLGANHSETSGLRPTRHSSAQIPHLWKEREQLLAELANPQHEEGRDATRQRAKPRSAAGSKASPA